MHAFGAQSPAPRFRSCRSLSPIVAVSLIVTGLLATSLSAEEDDLTIGDWYRLVVERGGVTQAYEGTLIQATDHWLVLSTVARETSRQGVPYLMNVPGAGKWFSRSTTVQGEITCWLPIEAASIQAHRKAANPGEPKSLDVTDPPVKRSYLVDRIVKGNVVKVQRDLLKVSGDTLLFGPPNASPTAQRSRQSPRHCRAALLARGAGEREIVALLKRQLQVLAVTPCLGPFLDRIAAIEAVFRGEGPCRHPVCGSSGRAGSSSDRIVWGAVP